MIFFLLLSLITADPSGGANAGKGAVASDVDKRREVVVRVFDRVSIEISKEYVTSKGMPFPNKIKTITDLEAFLLKIYPDEGHELRRAVLNLNRYRDRADADTPLDDYLKRGLDQFAVDLNGNPLPYDRKKIEKIIEETTSEKKPQSPQERAVVKEQPRSDVELQPTNGSLLTGFVNRHALLLTTFLLASNAMTLLVLLLMWVKGRPSTVQVIEHTVTGAGTILALQTVKMSKEQKADVTPDVTPAPDEISKNQSPQAPPPEAALSETSNPQDEQQPEVEDDEPAIDGSWGHDDDERWLVVKASLPGKLHTDNNPPIPCQDSCFYGSLGEGWGLAVVCDGAGSKRLSHHGAKYVATQAAEHFRNYITHNGMRESKELPSDSDWQEHAQSVFITIKTDLDRMAREKHNVDSKLLSCTLIVVIHAPSGLMTAHVGDGRAAFCTTDHEWKALMKPYKGEEANQTVFITALDQENVDRYVESSVVRQQARAFALMSDGCESHSFEVNIREENEEKYFDPNRPYPKFFQPLVSTLKTLHAANTPKAEIEQKWKKFIESGTEKLKNESDDKTMILGVLLD